MQIPIGHRNAIKRPNKADRRFRMDIENANNNGDYIINIGTGYFRPDKTDTLDVAMFNQYIRSEYNRARAILSKTKKMKEAFEHGEVCER